MGEPTQSSAPTKGSAGSATAFKGGGALAVGTYHIRLFAASAWLPYCGMGKLHDNAESKPVVGLKKSMRKIHSDFPLHPALSRRFGPQRKGQLRVCSQSVRITQTVPPIGSSSESAVLRTVVHCSLLCGISHDSREQIAGLVSIVRC